MSIKNRHGKQAPVFSPSGGELVTKQAPAKETDINWLMKKYVETGDLASWNRREPRYGDFSSVEDFHSAMNRVIEAEEAFEDLPSTVREHFNNDPAELLAASFDESRVEEFRALGLVPRGEEPPQPEAPPDETSE